MKKVMLIGIILLLLPIIHGYQNNQVFTQEQINNINVGTITKQDIGLNMYNWSNRNWYSDYLNYEFLNIYPQPDGTYKALKVHEGVIFNSADAGVMCFNSTIGHISIDCIENEYIPSLELQILNWVRFNIYHHKEVYITAKTSLLNRLCVYCRPYLGHVNGGRIE